MGVLGRVYHAAARVMGGDPGAFSEILDGIALSAETGSQAGAPGLFAVLAEAQRDAGQPNVDGELHRLDGDCSSRPAAPPTRRPPAITAPSPSPASRGARSFELRAATSLARLRRDQGKRAEARDLVAPVYRWFTEGFDTRDLQDAKRLLNELE